jgi:hypothetical protein
MGVWWHLRQWVYARPPVAAAGAVVLLLIVGFGGWESARQLSSDEAAPTGSNVTHRVTVAKTLRIKGKDGHVVNHVIVRTRTRNGVTVKATPAVIAKTVRSIRTETQRAIRNRTVTHVINAVRTVTFTQTRTQTVQSQNRSGIPPGHDRPIVTVTVTVTVTQPVTVTVTTSKGH